MLNILLPVIIVVIVFREYQKKIGADPPPLAGLGGESSLGGIRLF